MFTVLYPLVGTYLRGCPLRVGSELRVTKERERERERERESERASEREEVFLHSLNRLHIVRFWRNSPQWTRASSFTRSLDHTQRRTTVSITPLDERSARRRDLYLTTHIRHSQQTDIHAPGGIRTHNLSRRADSELRRRPRGHWNRQIVV